MLGMRRRATEDVGMLELCFDVSRPECGIHAIVFVGAPGRRILETMEGIPMRAQRTSPFVPLCLCAFVPKSLCTDHSLLRKQNRGGSHP